MLPAMDAAVSQEIGRLAAVERSALHMGQVMSNLPKLPPVRAAMVLKSNAKPLMSTLQLRERSRQGLENQAETGKHLSATSDIPPQYSRISSQVHVEFSFPVASIGYSHEKGLPVAVRPFSISGGDLPALQVN
jgi:hypothetical protein